MLLRNLLDSCNKIKRLYGYVDRIVFIDIRDRKVKTFDHNSWDHDGQWMRRNYWWNFTFKSMEYACRIPFLFWMQLHEQSISFGVDVGDLKKESSSSCKNIMVWQSGKIRSMDRSMSLFTPWKNIVGVLHHGVESKDASKQHCFCPAGENSRWKWQLAQRLIEEIRGISGVPATKIYDLEWL